MKNIEFELFDYLVKW